MATLAFSAARSSGVTPWSSAALTSAPARSSRSTSSLSSQCAAHKSAVAPVRPGSVDVDTLREEREYRLRILVRGSGHDPQVLGDGRGGAERTERNEEDEAAQRRNRRGHRFQLCIRRRVVSGSRTAHGHWSTFAGYMAARSRPAAVELRFRSPGRRKSESLKVRRDPVAKTLRLRAQPKQPLQILERPLDHHSSATARLPRIAVPP